MNIDLLKRLLPGEVDEYLVRNEVRADGRELREHRPLQITHSVMGGQSQLSSEQAAADDTVKVSCAVKLG